MDPYTVFSPEALLQGNSYVGRGLVLGCTPDGTRAVAAYFIMGRSENSRNRVFALEDGVLYTRPFDESKLLDPSLILYTALRQEGDRLLVTNGDQTDTAAEGLRAGKSLHEALRERRFEPDAPNYTPRISGLIRFDDGGFSYQLSLLKRADAVGTACCRFLYDYPALPGLGHFLHTYVCDGDPLPSFRGEPERMQMLDDIDAFTHRLWQSLDTENKIALYVRFVDCGTLAYAERLINKNQGGAP